MTLGECRLNWNGLERVRTMIYNRLKQMALTSAFSFFVTSMAIPAAAATYVYEYLDGGRGILTLDGTADVRLPLLKGADFDLKFVFNGPNLYGDNAVFIPVTSELGSRITFTLRPELDVGGDTHSEAVGLRLKLLENNPISFTTWTYTYNLEDGYVPNFVGIIDWITGPSLVSDSVIFGFLQGSSYDAPPRSSTYRVTVTAIPIPATGVLLLSCLVGFAAVRRRKHKFSHR